MEADTEQSVPTPEDITLAEDGDITLILNDNCDHKRSCESLLLLRQAYGLLVFADIDKILSAASPVFKAMLGSHFLEGQKSRTVEEPQEIELPEDGLYGMTIVLEWMHSDHTNEALCEQWHPCGVTHIAAYLDRYRCGRALSLIDEATLKRCAERCISGDFGSNDTTDLEVYETIVWSAKAAYLLGADDLFAQFTRRLVLDGIAPYSHIPKYAEGHSLPNEERLPVTVLLGMEEQRNKARNLMLHLLSQVTDRKLSAGHHSGKRVVFGESYET
ncbi:hypothetical protein LTR56_004856 [Elasticomyces elasticus]|nr:hypothetical protein LTR56_004856 [Elasticomyces elasticus]KAK3664630.1 hypothetical protein LTR22_004498 [Elasticomyces elasticus]KAK4918402.1 hypothetical protein LTR49_013794 [Elasticomyces elasticus]KAK5760340.1 hypothetical protein LTS12_009554 [Elasticomyces elasticus]